jgi:hypothetical protein
MNTVASVSLKIGRQVYHVSSVFDLRGKRRQLDCSGQDASDLIKQKLASADPCMICRFGSNELSATLQHLDINRDKRSLSTKIVKYIQGEIGSFWWEEKTLNRMQFCAGLFPVNEDTLTAFGERMLTDIQNIDILGSWRKYEYRLADYFPTAKFVKLEDLEPYYHKNPWSEVLKDKTVLVIHPFAETIEQQYQKHHVLFENPHVLPKFHLKTLKAVQSIAGNKPNEFDNWFDALDWMCDEVSKIDFDIAIIGAGAYGLPLASFVKSIGRKAVHLGGATQILFGIRGKRWESSPFFRQLFNENWIVPSTNETPANFKKVESGCYW